MSRSTVGFCAPPVIRATARAGRQEGVIVRAHLRDAVVDDGHSFLGAVLEWSTAGGARASGVIPMAHVGGGVFRTVLPLEPPAEGTTVTYRIVARDRAGNVGRSSDVTWTR